MRLVSGAAWMATSAREITPIMRSATLRNAIQVSIIIALNSISD